ncbi:uncharacterized protein SCHCODRAFT_02614512 [Schizophyllum commune H4-8]|nr:uncharacterized protein SCHCODRAFT_02614512 [Schizophyllum commune H4-8]KAI5896302.1 hypothetical protein SCHCODRAFT_02614512 [Schizophyllum commune H4-8]
MRATEVEGNMAHKRKRTAMEAEMDKPPTRSKIWFEDGNIVLQAENVQFKFYKGLLSTYSPFFMDVFAVPQPVPISDADMVEGCQVMKLPDTAADAEYMLSYIIEPKLSTATPSIADMIAALKMGHKYLISSLWEDTVERLRYEFPDTLDEYMKRPVAQGTLRFTRMHLSTTREHLLHLVDVVRSTGLQRILPILCLSAVDSGKLLNLLIDGIPDTPRLDGPSVETRLMLLGGRTRALASTQTATRNVFVPASMPEGCSQPSVCSEDRRNLRDVFLTRLENGGRLAIFEDWDEILAGQLGKFMCLACEHDLLQKRRAAQQVIWDALPSFFGLPVWAELKNFEMA